MALAVSIQRGLHINEQLRLRDAQLLEINEQLEQRVEERTASLDQARNALMESERLAALGAIVAGVAHGIRPVPCPCWLRTGLAAARANQRRRSPQAWS